MTFQLSDDIVEGLNGSCKNVSGPCHAGVMRYGTTVLADGDRVHHHFSDRSWVGRAVVHLIGKAGSGRVAKLRRIFFGLELLTLRDRDLLLHPQRADVEPHAPRSIDKNEGAF